MGDGPFQIAAIAAFAAAMAVSGWHRVQADRRGGRVRDGSVSTGAALRRAVLALGALGLIVLCVAGPERLAWIRMGLPDWARWLGVALDVLVVGLLWWMFHHLGRNVTPTTLPRDDAELVTSGPYRYVRHPLYSLGVMLLVALALISDTWPLLSILPPVAWWLVRRVADEERHLVARFGDDYREYRKGTGRFIPHLGGAAAR